MNILGIDTSTRTMSIGLVQDDIILGELNFYSNMDHSERLIDNISFLLKANDLTINDIDLIGVAIGPGSFTGVRIGIATVMGLCEFKEIPVVPVSSLEVLSRNFSSSDYVAVCVDAKRDRVYGGIYDYSSNDLDIIKEDLFNLEEFLELISDYENTVIAGDLNEKIKELGQYNFNYAIEGNLINRGSNICFIAKKDFNNNKSINHKQLQANYMTKPQAQMDLEKNASSN